MRIPNIHRAATAALSASTIALTLLASAHSAQAWTYKMLYGLCSKRACTDGAAPQAGITIDVAGNLYGQTYFGGEGGVGVTYEYSQANGTFEVLHGFCKRGGACKDGSNPFSIPIVDVAGNVYATTAMGGRLRGGVIFKIAPRGAARRFDILHVFCVVNKGCPDGESPHGDELTYPGAASGALYDGMSPLYGTTWAGGTMGNGVVYRLVPPLSGGDKWKETVVYSFCTQNLCPDGRTPVAGLLLDAAGNLYGTAQFGGANNEGVVFELSPSGNTWIYTVLYNFCSQTNCADGKEPAAPVVMDASGALYGSAQLGGANGRGVLFKLAPNGANSQYTNLYDFCAAANCSDGSQPLGSLVVDGAGNIYGTTYNGGPGDLNHNGAGTIYQWNAGSYHVLYAFCPKGKCKDGEFPQGVVGDSNGNLFGATFGGGEHLRGAVFELSP